MAKIGELGEKLVSEWLKTLDWRILAHRWRCPWGEIDIISHSTSNNILALIEVKTRSFGNWDADGLLAINAKKQIKLIKTASLFLADNPHLALLPCRFDVALVSYEKAKFHLNNQGSSEINLGKPVFWEGYQLTLTQYIESAFAVEE